MAAIESAGAGQRIVPDYTPGVQPRTGRVYRLVRGGAACRRIYESHGHRVAGGARGPEARPDLDQRPDHRGPQTGGRGGRQRAAGTGTGVGDRTDQRRPVARCPSGQLAFPPSGAGAPERAGRPDEEGPARPRYVRDAPRLRVTSIGIDEPDDETRPTEGQPLVYRGPRREARAGADHPDADMGEKCNRRMDLRSWR